MKCQCCEKEFIEPGSYKISADEVKFTMSTTSDGMTASSDDNKNLCSYCNENCELVGFHRHKFRNEKEERASWENISGISHSFSFSVTTEDREQIRKIEYVYGKIRRARNKDGISKGVSAADVFLWFVDNSKIRMKSWL